MSETPHPGQERQDAIVRPAEERMPDRGQANYSAAKAGMQGLTKTLAIELGQFGITANAVAPGFIATDMTAATAARLGMTFEDFQASVASRVPARRIGEVDDVAHAISFLASEGARYVSGQVIYVAGGPCAERRLLSSPVPRAASGTTPRRRRVKLAGQRPRRRRPSPT
jgi:NAD(P)-dependent dehydrogenase (short-subunit alcohol dehydrogenase family)